MNRGKPMYYDGSALPSSPQGNVSNYVVGPSEKIIPSLKNTEAKPSYYDGSEQIHLD